jgi:hypothetical protein
MEECDPSEGERKRFQTVPTEHSIHDVDDGLGRLVGGRQYRAEGKPTEWKSTALRAYQRRTKQADSLIAGAQLAGTNTRCGAPGAVSGLPRCGQQGHGEPGVAAKGDWARSPRTQSSA